MQFENDETLTDEIIYNNVEAVQHAWLINKKRYSFFYPFEVNVLIINKICFSSHRLNIPYKSIGNHVTGRKS